MKASLPVRWLHFRERERGPDGAHWGLSLAFAMLEAFISSTDRRTAAGDRRDPL